MLKTSRYVSAIAAVALAGCTVGPDYKTPEVKVPASFGEAQAVAQPAAPAPAEPPKTTVVAPLQLSDWWTTFNDAPLDTLIDRAVRSNLDLRRAQARVLEARAQRGITSADLFPAVDVDAFYTRSRSSKNIVPNSPADLGKQIDLYHAGFDASWEVDVFGGVRREVEAADADLAASVEDRRDVLVTLLAEVARNYVALRGFQQQIAIAIENLKSQQETLELTQTRVAGGLGSDLDVARAEAQVQATASTIPTLEASARQTIHALGVLLGQEPMSLSEELSKSAAIPVAPPQVPVGLPSELLRRRPDVRRAERQIAAATARIGVATADLFPKFSLTGSLGLESSTFKKIGNFESRFWSIGPSVSWTILDFGRIRNNIAVQDARELQAAAVYEQVVLTSLRDVEDALVAYAQEQSRHKSLAAAVEANKRARDLAEQLYKQGQTDFLSVLDAQRSLFTAQDTLVQSDRLISNNLVAIYKALGGGWEVEKR
jgi:multidrug efflux system outer membrane protein